MCRILLLIVLLTAHLNLHAQEVEDKKSRFPLFELSKGDDNTKNLNWGNFHFSNESYSKAAERLSKVENPSVETQRKTATAYMEIDSVDRAMSILEQIIDADKDVEAEDYLNLSQLQDMSGMYNEANKNRKKYSRQKAREVRVSLFETDDDYYQKLLNTLSKYDLKNLETNTELSDFGGYAVRSGDDGEDISMIFASSGIQNTGKLSRSKYIRPERPTFNLFTSDFVEDSIHSSNASLIGGSEMNTAFQDGPAVVSEDGKTIYFTRSGTKSGRDAALHLNIYSANINGSSLSRVRNLPFNNDEYSVMHPTLSKDGTRLYFSSNMPDGLGGYDLYYVDIDGNGRYSEPVNLGPGINTEGNEVFPFIFREDVLFFASNAHPGLGGLDVYMTVDLGTENQQVLNMGTPFNTSSDDFCLYIDTKFKFGYISSNRRGGKGEDDIYSFKIDIPAPFGVDDYYTMARGDTLVLGDLGVLVNDGEVAGTSYDILQGLVSRSTLLDEVPNKGSLDFKDNGTFSYVNTDLSADLDTFTYIVSNGALESEPVNVRIKIIDPTVPLAQQDIITFAPGEPVRIEQDTLLANDSDPGGDPLEAIIISEPQFGEINFTEGGGFEYIPDDEIPFTSDTVFYVASDGFQSDTSFVVLSKLAVGVNLADIIEINPIYFDFDKANIRSDAALELDKIVKVLEDYPTMVIELGSHTDCRGSDEYNLYLSDRRAKSSAAYVQERIDNAKRIYGKGFGETTPNVPSPAGCGTLTEQEHQLNRRTEFIIVELGGARTRD
jgi:outer membrane protein OmpA-like peptidoglycan-associated protein